MSGLSDYFFCLHDQTIFRTSPCGISEGAAFCVSLHQVMYGSGTMSSRIEKYLNQTCTNMIHPAPPPRTGTASCAPIGVSHAQSLTPRPPGRRAVAIGAYPTYRGHRPASVHCAPPNLSAYARCLHADFVITRLTCNPTISHMTCTRCVPSLYVISNPRARPRFTMCCVSIRIVNIRNR